MLTAELEAEGGLDDFDVFLDVSLSLLDFCLRVLGMFWRKMEKY